MAISEDGTMVYFDVVSLFTAIPVAKACTYIRNKLENDDTLSDRTQLDVDDILRLLEFVYLTAFSFTTTEQIIQTDSWMCHGQSLSVLLLQTFAWK